MQITKIEVVAGKALPIEKVGIQEKQQRLRWYPSCLLHPKYP